MRTLRTMLAVITGAFAAAAATRLRSVCMVRPFPCLLVSRTGHPGTCSVASLLLWTGRAESHKVKQPAGARCGK